VRAAILLGVLHMSLQHVRHEIILGVVGPLILAEPFGRALGRAEGLWTPWRLPTAQTLLGGALFAAVIVGRMIVPQVRVDGPTAPITALAHVPAALRREPVLNGYDFGGYLIFQGVRPYIDGRTDMYGDAFMADDNQIQYANRAAMDRAIARYGVRWAILPPTMYLAEALERAPGWKQLYADKTAVVLANENPPPPAPATPSSPPPAPVRTSSAHGL
jgi:hypothetical protein